MSCWEHFYFDLRQESPLILNFLRKERLSVKRQGMKLRSCKCNAITISCCIIKYHQTDIIQTGRKTLMLSKPIWKSEPILIKNKCFFPFLMLGRKMQMFVLSCIRTWYCWFSLVVKWFWSNPTYFRYHAASYDEALIKVQYALEIESKELGARDERMAELYQLLAHVYSGFSS